jgi:hypothetical protein
MSAARCGHHTAGWSQTKQAGIYSKKCLTACLCAGDIHVGWLVETSISGTGQIAVPCGLPTFFPDGSLSSQVFCTNFSTLAK